jgi:LysM repeat protein
LQTDGTVKYLPNFGFTGKDMFTYEVCDSGGSCDRAEVTIEVAQPPETLKHTVEQGDWLIQIARCYGTTVQAIRNANYIYNPNYLLPGQILTIPNVNSLGTFTGPSCLQRYTVKAGDTTASVAAQHGITESELRRVNGMPYPNGNFLRVGQVIVVPRPVPDYMLP